MCSCRCFGVVMGVVLAFAPLSPFFGVLVGSVVLLSGPNDDADLWSAMVDRFFAEDAAEDLLASVASAKCPNFSNSVLVLLSGLETTDDLWCAMADRFFAEDAAEDLLASVASAKCPNVPKSVFSICVFRRMSHFLCSTSRVRVSCSISASARVLLVTVP